MVSITFISVDNERNTVDVRSGISLMEAAIQNEVPGIDAECGGACSCATCHVYIDEQWVERAGKPSGIESGMLEAVVEPRFNSRLACQIPVTESLDGLVVMTPQTQQGDNL